MTRLWTWIVRGAFIFMLPIWFVLWGQQIGYVNLSLIALLLFLFGMWRSWPTA